jgi:hypothetical protein
LDIIKNLESFYNGDNEISTLADEIGLNEDLKEFLNEQQYSTVYNFYSKIKGLTDDGAGQQEISRFFNDFYDQVNENKKLSDEQKNYLWEQLSITDWSSIEDIDSTFSILSEILGGSNDTLLSL